MEMREEMNTKIYSFLKSMLNGKWWNLQTQGPLPRKKFSDTDRLGKRLDFRDELDDS